MGEQSCIFCRISQGELPAQVLLQDDRALAFRDIHPAAPTHVLVIPREHIPSLAQVTSEHSSLLAHLVEMANQMARAEGLGERGYRIVANVGPDSGSEVGHLHLHVLGGRALGSMG